MAKVQTDGNSRYFPPPAIRRQVQPWIDSDRWFMQRSGEQRELLLAIARDCGYTTLPKKPESIKALIGGHLSVYFSKKLALQFNLMVDEL